MGNCCCWCAGSAIDPDDPSVTFYVLTTNYMIYRRLGFRSSYGCPCPKAVYVQDDVLDFDCCRGGCFAYPLRNISSVELVHGLNISIQMNRPPLHLNNGVLVRGNDGTIIVFSVPEEAEKIVQQLQSVVESAQKKVATF